MNIQNEILIPIHKDWNEDRQVAGANSPHKSAEALKPVSYTHLDVYKRQEVIYLFSLSDKSEDEDFVKNFVSCFKKNQSDEDLIKTVNQKFGDVYKRQLYVQCSQRIYRRF